MWRQLLSVEIPADYGGSEASFMCLCLTIEELSKVDPVVGLLCDLQNTVVNNVFLVRAALSAWLVLRAGS